MGKINGNYKMIFWSTGGINIVVGFGSACCNRISKKMSFYNHSMPQSLLRSRNGNLVSPIDVEAVKGRCGQLVTKPTAKHGTMQLYLQQ